MIKSETHRDPHLIKIRDSDLTIIFKSELEKPRFQARNFS